MSGFDRIVGGSGPERPGPADEPAWWLTAAGRIVLTWEQTEFDRALADVFGFHAVQLGLDDWPALQANRMPHHVIASLASGAAHRDSAGQARPGGPQRVIVEDFACLPFETDSLDLVVAPHALEQAVDPRQVLREINRVLRPEGRVVVSGFNPVSLWGIRRALGRRSMIPQFASMDHWINVPRLKDWFALLGLECQPVRHGVYRPLLRREAWLERTRFMEPAGDRWWPICGAAYVAVAIKRVNAMRLVGADFKRKALAAHMPALGARRDSGPVR